VTEVDRWTGFSDHFTHLRTGNPAADKASLLAAILADGTNLGLSRMADTSHGLNYHRLVNVAQWHITEDNYASARAAIINAHGRIERTLFTLKWLSDPALRQLSHAGLNKGEASNSLRRALFFHRQGEFRDRTFENQSFRASGLTLVTAAIVHWNTAYLDLAVQLLRTRGVNVSDSLLAHVAPLGWEHIALTGDYVWSTADTTDSFRPLRDVPRPFLCEAA